MPAPSIMVPWLLVLAGKASLVLAAAFVITTLLRRASAASRHVVWFAAFLGLLALPVAGLVLPSFGVPVLPADTEIALAYSPVPDEAVVAATPGTPATPAAPAAPVVAVMPARGVAGGVAGGVGKPRPPLKVAASADAYWVIGGPAPSEPGEVTLPRDASTQVWPMRVFLMWLFGFVMVAVAFAVGVLRTHVVACSALPAVNDMLSDEVEILSAELGIVREVRVMTWPGPAMPMTWGARRPIILLPEAARDWPVERRREVLTHELAHILRGDYLARLLAAFVCALHWFNPLVWLAAGRMRNEQELACDDTVLSTGVQPSDYATHLLEVARSLKVPSFAMANASVAMARPSQLTGRLLAVLDESRTRVARAPRRTVAAAWLLSIAVIASVGAAAPVARDAGPVPNEWTPVAAADWYLPWAPKPAEVAPVAPAGLAVPPVMAAVAVPQGTCDDLLHRRAGAGAGAGSGRASAGGSGRAGAASTATGRGRTNSWTSSNSSSSDDGSPARVTLSIREGRCQIEVRLTGVVRFNDQETDVVPQAGASARVTEDDGDRERRFEAVYRGGQLQRRFWVDGDEVPESAELRAWLAQALQTTLWRTGWNIVPRTMRAYRGGGLDSVIRLAEATGSDYSRRMALSTLIDSVRVPAAEAARIARQAADMSSDYERAELLIMVARKVNLDAGVQDAMVEAAGGMSSDYEKRRVLTAALERADIPARSAARLLEVAARMSSDYEKAELLITFSRGRGLDDDMRQAFLRATSNMSSDYERRRTLTVVADKPDVSTPILLDVASQAGEMSSDYERAELLLVIARRYRSNDDVRSRVARVAQRMSSDYERNRVLAQVGVREF